MSSACPCFNPCYLGCCSERLLQSWVKVALIVSILVILDVALKGDILELWKKQSDSFNPCYLGCCSERSDHDEDIIADLSFNPCYLGCCSESWPLARAGKVKTVSILVILDVALKVSELKLIVSEVLGVSILVILDVALKGSTPGRTSNDFLFQSLLSWMLL